MSMMSLSEIRDSLLKLGASRVTMLSRGTDCVILLMEVEGRSFIVALYNGYVTLYAKIVPQEHVVNPDCSLLMYEPRGLYAFSNDLNELLLNVISKARRLARGDR